MINAKEARELLLRCTSYQKQLDEHLETIGFLIKKSACSGNCILIYNIYDESNTVSLAYDLEKKLREYNYRVAILRSHRECSLEIRW